MNLQNARESSRIILVNLMLIRKKFSGEQLEILSFNLHDPLNIRVPLTVFTVIKNQEHKQDLALNYFTANVDDDHFNRAITTYPFAFLSKPFRLRNCSVALN